jgi:hypothetical protein
MTNLSCNITEDVLLSASCLPAGGYYVRQKEIRSGLGGHS